MVALIKNITKIVRSVSNQSGEDSSTKHPHLGAGYAVIYSTQPDQHQHKSNI